MCCGAETQQARYNMVWCRELAKDKRVFALFYPGWSNVRAGAWAEYSKRKENPAHCKMKGNKCKLSDLQEKSGKQNVSVLQPLVSPALSQPSGLMKDCMPTHCFHFYLIKSLSLLSCLFLILQCVSFSFFPDQRGVRPG